MARSPDARYIAFVSPPEPQEHDHLFILDVENQKWTDLTQNWNEIHPQHFWPNAIYWSPNGKMLAYGDTTIGIIYLMQFKN